MARINLVTISVIIVLCSISVFALNIFNDSINVSSVVNIEMKNISNSTIIIDRINPYKNNDFKELKINNQKVIFDELININLKNKLNMIKNSDDSKYILIRFNRNPTRDEIELLQLEGIYVLEYTGINSYYVKFNNKFSNVFEIEDNALKFKSEKIKDKYLVKNIAEIKNEYKLSNYLSKEIIKKQEYDLTLIFHRDIDIHKIKSKLNKENKISVIGELSVLNGIVVHVNKDGLNKLLNMTEIKYIDISNPLIKDSLDESRGIINSNYIFENLNLKGDNIKILQYESHSSMNHTDFGNRLHIEDSGATYSSHATHVAGIIFGNGTIDSDYRGIAPQSSIYAFEYDWYLGNLDISNNYIEAIDDLDVDLASNSWLMEIDGDCDLLGDYNSRTLMFDEFVYGENDRNKIPIVFAVGNENDVCKLQYYNTVAAEASGKNTISVGAINVNNNSIYNASGLGPTDNNRLKPEIVAPGCENNGDSYTGIKSTNVISNVSTYSEACGTSQAAPHVSGTIALMLEQWNLSGFTSDPLPSTIKAMLLDSATDLENDGSGTQTIDGPDYINYVIM